MERRVAGAAEEGMIGLLIAVVIIGVMATIAVVALQRAGDRAAPAAGLPTPAGLPGGMVVGTEPGAGGATSSARGTSGLVDAARTAECVNDARTIATAVQAYQVTHGVWPATIQDLADAGLLATAPAMPGYAFSIDQAGGQVLVNGAVPVAGCAAPAGR